jgi:hypothetical protein
VSDPSNSVATVMFSPACSINNFKDAVRDSPRLRKLVYGTD